MPPSFGHGSIEKSLAFSSQRSLRFRRTLRQSLPVIPTEAKRFLRSGAEGSR